MNRRVLILGVTGMLGHVLFRQCSEGDVLDLYGTAMEGLEIGGRFKPGLRKKLLTGVDVLDFQEIIKVIDDVRPDVVINAIGLVDQYKISTDVLTAIEINAEFPQKLSAYCSGKARIIHISTDGVFDGKKGMYSEEDDVSISDVYGMTKFLGEVKGPHCVTLRTSIIGHQLIGKSGLVEWFLSQNADVKGYRNVIYSGFPTIELARIIIDYVIPHKNLSGIYHVSSQPISKYDLLKLIAKRYGKHFEIEPDNQMFVNRSLDSSLFRSLTGYVPPEWCELVNEMYGDYLKYEQNYD